MRKCVLCHMRTTKAQISLHIRTCEQQRRRSACTSAQSDQRICCSLLRWYYISRFYSRILYLASVAAQAGLSGLVVNPEDTFCHVVAHIHASGELCYFSGTTPPIVQSRTGWWRPDYGLCVDWILHVTFRAMQRTLKCQDLKSVSLTKPSAVALS